MITLAWLLSPVAVYCAVRFVRAMHQASEVIVDSMTERKKTVATPIVHDSGSFFPTTMVCLHCHRKIQRAGIPSNYVHADSGKVECHE